MQHYLTQLLSDITQVTESVSWPFADDQKEFNLLDMPTPEEEDQIAPVRELEEWTGIKKEMLPPDSMLNDEQISILLKALIKMLDAYNCCFVTQIQVPERIQYACIRDYFDQPVRVKRWHMGCFEFCRPGTKHQKCALGEYCHCAFFAEMFKDMVDGEQTPEEERARMLEIELKYIKRKYGDEWMKYYPYHLDKDFDDKKGNPYDYGFGDFEDEEDDEDNWWRK